MLLGKFSGGERTVMNEDADYGWDGGYEDLVDSGDGVEEIYIGPLQRYDMDEGHVPDGRFATRPVVPGRRPELEIESSATQDSPDSAPPQRPSKKQSKRRNQPSSTAKRRPKKGRDNYGGEAVRHAAKVCMVPEGTVRIAVFGSATDGERARQLGLTVRQVRRLRAKYSDSLKTLNKHRPRLATRQSAKAVNQSSTKSDNGSRSGAEGSLPNRKAPKKLTKDQLKTEALSVAARTEGITIDVADSALFGPGNDKMRAEQVGVKLAVVKRLRAAYTNARAQLAPRTRTIEPVRRQPRSTKSLTWSEGPRSGNYCQACEQPIRYGAICGCS